MTADAVLTLPLAGWAGKRRWRPTESHEQVFIRVIMNIVAYGVGVILLYWSGRKLSAHCLQVLYLASIELEMHVYKVVRSCSTAFHRAIALDNKQ